VVKSNLQLLNLVFEETAMKRLIIFVTLGLIGYCCGAQTSPSPAGPQPSFSITLSPPVGTIKAGSAIEIGITVQNVSGKDITWEAEFGDTAYKAFHFMLIKEDHEVETTFFHRKIRGKPRPEDPDDVSNGSSFLGTLAAGKSIVQTIDLKRLYQITEPGSYTLDVSRYDDESKRMVSAKTLTLKIGL